MDKFFLYIDILGFANLVETNTKKVKELYEIIASLNVHHNEYFEAIIFSDTILVYNAVELRNSYDVKVVIMYLCEFVKDLQSRLAGRNILFRAIITAGEFYHYRINKIPCFFGHALNNAYQSDKRIQAMGLFIDNYCAHYCDIFDIVDYDRDYKFVFITQNLKNLESNFGNTLPIDEVLVEQIDIAWLIVPEILTIENIYRQCEHPDSKIRKKSKTTFAFYKKHYPKIIKQLVKNDFKPHFISPLFNWEDVIKRYPEDFSYVNKSSEEHN